MTAPELILPVRPDAENLTIKEILKILLQHNSRALSLEIRDAPMIIHISITFRTNSYEKV